MKSEKEKMLAGELYFASDPELVADRAIATRWNLNYNTSVDAAEQRHLLEQQLAFVGRARAPRVDWERCMDWRGRAHPSRSDDWRWVHPGRGQCRHGRRAARATVVGNPARCTK
ncbi:MAG TPA: maltose acetyltransferase domain-containing protein [Gemmatimonadaceae bacterium]|nr:maltose acetyltransferase domain-containing protein [Gemmatimonadaceae bacterium]